MSKYNLEELAEVAKRHKAELIEKSKKEDDSTNSVESFVLTFNIRKGPFFIAQSRIYFAYCNWTKKPKSKQYFLDDFSTLFDVVEKPNTNVKGYMINYKPMNLFRKAQE